MAREPEPAAEQRARDHADDREDGQEILPQERCAAVSSDLERHG